MMNKAGTTSTTSKPVGLKPSQKDNKVPVKKDAKSDPVKAPVKKPAASKSTTTTTTQVPAPQEVPNTDNNPEFTKPTELRFEFIQAIQSKDYDKALSLAEEIKKIEPNNVLITHFQEFLNQNIESLKADEEEEEEEEGEEGEEGEEDEDENEDEDEDEDEKDEDEEDENEEDNENENEEQDRDEQNKSMASTAAQSERSKIGE